MATGTNGIATKADCNSKYVYAFSSGDLTQCPTRQEIENAGFDSLSSKGYSTNQLVKTSDVTISAKTIKITLSNSLASKASLEKITVYLDGVSKWTKNFDGVSKNSSISWSDVTAPVPPISKSSILRIVVEKAGADRTWWYADNVNQRTWKKWSADDIFDTAVISDYAKWFVNGNHIRIHIGNQSDTPPTLSW